jgi:hypothetical protein
MSGNHDAPESSSTQLPAYHYKESNPTPVPDALADLPKPPDRDAWPDPLPVVSYEPRRRFPVEALPGRWQDLVGEQASLVQVDPGAAWAVADSAASCVLQALIDIERNAALRGPVSVYHLVLADSGERKSELFRRFFAPIEAWQAAERFRLRHDIADHVAALAAWKARRDGLLSRIKAAAAAEDETECRRYTELLQILEGQPPAGPMVPDYVATDETVQRLMQKLAQWPTRGLALAEAGLFLGGHSMSPDGLLQTLGVLNSLWSGESLTRARISETKDVILSDTRLSVCLMAQPSAWAEFVTKSNGLGRGTGLMSRFLITRSRPMAGTRLYQDPATTAGPCLAAFGERARELLALGLPSGGRRLIQFNEAARGAWISYYDCIESQCGPSGELNEIADVGGKLAEQCARMAARLWCWTTPISRWGDGIDIACVKAASIVTLWHSGGQSETSSTPATERARALDAWMVKYALTCTGGAIPVRDILRFGPSPTRPLHVAERALEGLARHGRIRRAGLADGSGRAFIVNPKLYKGGINHELGTL